MCWYQCWVINIKSFSCEEAHNEGGDKVYLTSSSEEEAP